MNANRFMVSVVPGDLTPALTEFKRRGLFKDEAVQSAVIAAAEIKLARMGEKECTRINMLWSLEAAAAEWLAAEAAR